MDNKDPEYNGALDPEAQHRAYMDLQQKSIVKNAINMARVRYSITAGTRVYNYKVYIQIWQDDDFIYEEFLDYCKKLTLTGVTLNTNSYKAMADQLYNLIASEMPGRNIWICINQNDTGITIQYEQ